MYTPPSLPLSQAMWVPGSQTDLVIVSDTFVKIYALLTDLISPMYYFVILTGKIRDATIAVTEEVSWSVLYSTCVSIYRTLEAETHVMILHTIFHVVVRCVGHHLTV